MKIPYQKPDPSGTERAKKSQELRHLAHEIARLRPQALTCTNYEESDFIHEEGGDKKAVFPSNFTKGLLHNSEGLLEFSKDYTSFVEAINSKDRTLFNHIVKCAIEREPNDLYHTAIIKKDGKDVKHITPKWRGWESPRAGHVYELEGPDPGAVAMAPAPRIKSEEFTAEMAEVYALAILRDVRFTDWDSKHKGETICKTKTHCALTFNQVFQALKKLPFFKKLTEEKDHSTRNHSLSRRKARFSDPTRSLKATDLFRGSTTGAKAGPYISQFMLIGNTAFGKYKETEGLIKYGTQVIDQKVSVHKVCLDYLTDWTTWLDAQNGANFKGLDQFEEERRFISTPRDLATYVHFDALYQAYLNAALILLGKDARISKGFPEPSFDGKRDAFATFGGPHVLSLVTEVATRCLKSVRRQKFNYHRRCRPEAIGGRLTLVNTGATEMGTAADEAFNTLLDELPTTIKSAVRNHNTIQNNKQAHRKTKIKDHVLPCGIQKNTFNNKNLLLPMAFPEGSPMHPAYGAGHATVAGGCVTMLKAFFEMFDAHGNELKLELEDKTVKWYEPNKSGSALIGKKINPNSADKSNPRLSIQGELDKLAANISIGRNMAGVHFYSDYYDSLRMGERIAVGILMEQAPTYGDEMEMSFTSFDGDHIVIAGEANEAPTLTVKDKDGNSISHDDWWLRHTSGQETILDQ